ncbi:translocation/assembly module TamB domain-containing protein [Pontibacter sp. SGAir0037]|uniref:translocation/assembly module TamB domain-containing protein n=1 Tax=Pontibacter sp. SGAir0037 TaxID=2571030 RepID=UPI0010CD49CB|nr:translocation/assembly module TamB domain-containing protein [Pontibacter sp. SGAir0037]QCR23120.1 hypothetical protein C1N53_12695 [Pontibacter sp. SGAir0037]
MLDTRVEIGGLTTGWRNSIVLENIYVEDQQQDTLWYSERLGVDIKFFALLKGQVNIGKVHLKNASANVHIRPDSTSNFDFITEAFAGDTTAAATPADTTSGGMAISLDVIDLENIKLRFRDEAGGNMVAGRIGRFLTTMEELDLENERYLVDAIELRNTKVEYVQTKIPPPADEEPSDPLEMEFGLNRVALENIDISYKSEVADQFIELRLGESELTTDNIDLPNARVDLRSFDLKNTSLVYVQEKYKDPDSLAINPARTVEKLDKSVEESSGQPMDWTVNLNNMNIAGLHVRFDNFNTPAQAQGMDFNHMVFKDIQLNAKDVLYSQNKMGLNLQQLTLQEKSGFKVNNFQAQIAMDSTSASLTDLDLQTGHSRFRKELAVQYPSLEAAAENPNLVSLRLDIDNSYIGMQDALYFVPDLAQNPSFRTVANSTIRLNGQAEGRLDNLNINSFQVAGLQGTSINISGNVRNAMDPDRLFVDLNLNRFATTRTDIMALAPPGTIPPDINIPANVALTGNYTGTLENFDANATLQTSYGNINAVVDMQPGPTTAAPFNARVRTDRFDLEQLLGPEMGVGTISMEATATGAGFDPETMRADVRATIREAVYNDYRYNNIVVNAKVDQNRYLVEASSKDENLAFDLNGDFNLRNSEQPQYAFDADIDGINLQELHLYADDLAIQGKLKGNFTGADLSNLRGNLEASELVVRHQQVPYALDSVQLALAQSPTLTEVQLNSKIMDADMRFTNSLETLPTALQKHFSNYLDLQPDPPYPADLSLGDFNFTMQLRNIELIKSFVPDLETLKPSAPITGAYSRETQTFTMDGGFSLIEYQDFDLKDFVMEVRGNQEQLGYSLGLSEVSSPSFLVQNILLDGAARDDDMTLRLAISEDNGDPRFMLGGHLSSVSRNGYRFALNPGQIYINSEAWTVPEDNYFQFGGDVLYANNIRIQRGNSFILANSLGEVAPNAPLQVQFGNFEIAYLMESFQQADSLIAGTINGEATLRNLTEGNMAFTSDIGISSLAYMGVPVGDIALRANSATENRYNLEASLTGNGNRVLIGGFYEAQPETSTLNLDANIETINLAALQGFTADMVTDMGGTISGNMAVRGSVADPDITGQLNFNQAQFNPTMVGSLYRLQNERIVFNQQGINFPNFTITDINNNNLVVNGNILTQDYTDFRFDMGITTDRFLAVNSTVNDNDLFYGKLLLATNTTIKGTMAVPVINARVEVLDGSNMSFVVPADEAGAAAQEGIVQYGSLNDSIYYMVQQGMEDAETSGFVGAVIDAEIVVTDASPFTVVIDPLTGDQLEIRGNGTLTTAIAPNGEINLSGRYDITDGLYQMAFYSLVERELRIAEGSYIAWAGDPLMADVNISAIYDVKTAPRELVASEITGDQTEQNQLRNQLPFQVFVNVEGEMLEPEIGFDIQLPEEERGAFDGQIEAKLVSLRQDESEMNKQVFALLVLGRFLAPDPLQSSGGGLAASARNSLSQVMNDQLSRLTDRYAGGLGLELGVNSYEDYSSGAAEGRTDLNVAVRQQFLNDRLTVRVGGDIGLEGQSTEQNSMSNFGGDISVEYSILPDGRLRVRGFRRNQYESFLEGDVQATGASLIFQRDYDNFSELFKGAERRQARREERRREAATGPTSSSQLQAVEFD